ncbi:hypothetical protein [Scytonema sp. NUACC26]|uniref:hypothetical protein n=1 Tax=Scytonema sp. NUACC26 TaxID=3140176 RepID=UPI0034DC7332
MIIFDNLDRVPLTVADHLFFEYAAQLQELNCTIIYTVPISVLCSPKNPFTQFDGNPHIVPMVNIYEFKRDVWHLNYNREGLEAVASLIERRVDIDAVFESRQELLDLAKASGGHVRQLMQMMRSACQTASTRKHSKINAKDVIYAVKQQQFSFERFIPEEHYPFLAQVCLTKNVSKDDIGQLMLFNTSVLEYNGDKRWNYPNPVVKQNEFFQAALKSALSNNLKIERGQFLAVNQQTFAELITFVDFAEKFTIGFVEINFPKDREILIEALKSHPECQDIQFVTLDFPDSNLRFLKDEIVKILPTIQRETSKKLVLIVRKLENSIGVFGDYPPVLQDLNFVRDTYKKTLPHPILFILPDYALTRLAKFAPDFWAWRSGVFRFKTNQFTREDALAQTLNSEQAIDTLEKPEKQERIDLLHRLLMEYKPTGNRVTG